MQKDCCTAMSVWNVFKDRIASRRATALLAESVCKGTPNF